MGAKRTYKLVDGWWLAPNHGSSWHYYRPVRGPILILWRSLCERGTLDSPVDLQEHRMDLSTTCPTCLARFCHRPGPGR